MGRVRQLRHHTGICDWLGAVLILIGPSGVVRQSDRHQIAEIIVIVIHPATIASVGINDMPVNIVIKSEKIPVAALDALHLSKVGVKGICVVGKLIKISPTVSPLL